MRPLLKKFIKPNSLFSGICLMILGLFLIGIMTALIKQMGILGYSSFFTSFIRNIAGLSFAIGIMAANGYFTHKRKYFKVSRPLLAPGRGFIIVAAQLLFFSSIQFIDLATARALSYVSGLFVTILAVFLLKEKVGIWRTSAVVFGLLGAFMVLGEGVQIKGELWYYFLPIIGAFFYALSLTSLQLFSKKDHHLVLIFYSQIGATIISALVLTVLGKWQAVIRVEDLFFMASLGISGSLGVLCISFAYRFSEASLIAPFHYLGIIYSFLFGWIFFAEAPFDELFPGVLLIVGAGVITVWREAYKKKQRQKTEIF